jgi:hypothetical protein
MHDTPNNILSSDSSEDIYNTSACRHIDEYKH